MSAITIQRIQKLNAAQLDEIVAFTLRAYCDDAAIKMMTGGKDSFRDPLFRCMIRAGELEGEIYVALDEYDKILSIAMWFAPGYELFETEQQRALGFNQFLEDLKALEPATYDWWLGTYKDEVGDFLKRSLSPEKSIDTMYLNLLSTDPEFQRRGLATALLNDMIKKVAGSNASLALCTNSKKNESFYQGNGFITKGLTELLGLRGDHFPVFCLTQIVP